MAKQRNIRRRGKAWVVSARVNGTQQWKSCKTRDGAELALAHMLAQRARGETPARRVRATFAEVAEEWYRDRAVVKDWRVSTRRDYRYALDAHLLDVFGGFEIQRITTEQIQQWRTQAMRDGLPRRTAEKLLMILHGIFAHAGSSYGLSVNPAEAVGRLEVKYSGDLNFYSPEGVLALVRAAFSKQDAALFLTAAHSGLRRGELVALRVRDVDFDKRKIHVRRSFVLGELTSPKSGKVRSVPMALDVAQAIDALLKDRGDPVGDELVFPGTRGYLDASALRRRYVKARSEAGLRPLRFHDLRHVFGSTVINTASILQVKEWMGHSNIQTTMRYLHFKESGGDAEMVDAAFASQTLAQPLAVRPSASQTDAPGRFPPMGGDGIEPPTSCL